MGELVKHDINLRAWGASELLDVKGMISTNLETAQGAVVETKAYVVDDFYPEPLLGAGDAEALGFISIDKLGRAPPRNKRLGEV